MRNVIGKDDAKHIYNDEVIKKFVYLVRKIVWGNNQPV